MSLFGKHVLMIVSTGVEEHEVSQIKRHFAAEQAQVFVASPEPYLTVEAANNGKRGCDIIVDLPLTEVRATDFHALVLPDGLLSSTLLAQDGVVRSTIYEFYQQGVPIFASGKAVELLYESHVFPRQILVRDGEPLSLFLEQAVSILLEAQPLQYLQPVVRKR